MQSTLSIFLMDIAIVIGRLIARAFGTPVDAGRRCRVDACGHCVVHALKDPHCLEIRMRQGAQAEHELKAVMYTD